MLIPVAPAPLQTLSTPVVQPVSISNSGARKDSSTPGNIQPAVIISISTSGQSSATAAGLNEGEIAASARERVETYYAIKSEVAGLHWDDVAKDPGDEKTLELRQAYEQRIEDFGKTTTIEAAAAGVSASPSAGNRIDLFLRPVNQALNNIVPSEISHAGAFAANAQPASLLPGSTFNSIVEPFTLSSDAATALAVLRGTKVKA